VSAAALAAAGLVGVVAWAGSGCPGEPTDRALVADAPGGSRVPEDAAAAGRLDAGVAAGLEAVGLRAEPRWALGQNGRDATLDAVAVADDLVVTLQRSAGRGGARADTVVAAYDAATGADRWQLGWSATSGDGRLIPTQDGPLFVVVGATTASLAGVDAGTGRVLWCADDGRQAARTSVLAGADRVVVAAQDARDSSLRALEPSTGEERWRTDTRTTTSWSAPRWRAASSSCTPCPGAGGASLLHA
jgi:outer membrane protein assembly factor BamB